MYYLRNAFVYIYRNNYLRLCRYSISIPKTSKDYQDLSVDLKDLLVPKKDKQNIINNVQVLKQPSNNNKCVSDQSITIEEEEEEDLEEMFIEGPAGIEWNGPTRGGN